MKKAKVYSKKVTKVKPIYGHDTAEYQNITTIYCVF